MAARSVEGVLVSALQELGRVFGEKRVMNAAAGVLQTAAQTKAAMDDNVSMVLGLAGLPSRGDLDALRRQMDVMQATLANLSRKLDRVLDEVAERERGEGETQRHVPRRRRHRRHAQAIKEESEEEAG